MGRHSNFMKLFAEHVQSAEQTTQKKLQEKIAAGPPVDSGISTDAWRSWNEYGWWVCPRTKRTCSERLCGIGPSCQAMAAYGLAGDGAQLDYARRPTCGARNRKGQPCCNKVVPGKRRCRFHGGLSTGPRTVEGRDRIAAAQRRRWASRRSTEADSEISTVRRPQPTAPDPTYTDRYVEADDETTSGGSMLTI